MKKRTLSILLVVAMLLAMMPMVMAGEVRDDGFYYFTDRNGTELKAPINAFATKVIEFTPGSPWTQYAEQQKANNILGIPDRTGRDSTSVGDLCMGSGGRIVLEFDAVIYDGDGLDIYVFEVGDMVEATKIEVSSDLKNWYEVGTAQGKTAGVDLSGKVPDGAVFRYVRLTDMKSVSGTPWPGADIDAVSGLNIINKSDWVEDVDPRIIPPDFPPDWPQPITRAEFAAVATLVYEVLSETKATPVSPNPFTDTRDSYVLKAYNVGIVNGYGDGRYGPNDLLNREQCAAMLTRVVKRVRIPGWTLDDDAQYPLEYDMPAPFADDSDISDWAKNSVYYMAANGIINGIGNNKFAPKNTTPREEALGYATATREQALVIATRMVRNMDKLMVNTGA